MNNNNTNNSSNDEVNVVSDKNYIRTTIFLLVVFFKNVPSKSDT
jgi:hypothetical protein